MHEIERPGLDRRRFLHGLAAALPLLPALRRAAEAGPASGRATLVGPDEPGSPLVVSGRAFAPDSRRPLAGITLRVYHTDADGYYTRPVSDPRRARIRGSVVTDGQGRYELRTIKPGPYPERRQAAHIHVHLEGEGHPEHWIDSFLFEGDPYLDADERRRSLAAGRFGHVMGIRPDGQGILRASRDIRLDPALAERNRLVDGWYR